MASLEWDPELAVCWAVPLLSCGVGISGQVATDSRPAFAAALHVDSLPLMVSSLQLAHVAGLGMKG